MSASPLPAHPSPSGSVQHEPPRLSASGAERYLACPSAFARETEYFKWANESGIAGLTGGADAQRGTGIHKVVAQLPFASVDFGVDSFDIRSFVEETARKLDIKLVPYDAWLATRFVERRDEFVGWVLARHPRGYAGVEQMEILQDDTRLGKDFTGTPDYVVVVSGAGSSVAGVLDFKSGMGTHKSPQENYQLAVNSVLTRRRSSALPPPDVVYTVLVTETNLAEPMRIGRYDTKALEAFGALMDASTEKALNLANQVKAMSGSTDLPAQLDSALDQEARLGSHCLRCRGKVCCGAMKVAAAEVIEQASAHLKFIRENPIDRSMNTKKLSDGLAIGASLEQLVKLINAYREDAEKLTLQLHEKGVPIDDIKVEEGTARAHLEENDIRKLHELLGPLFKKPVSLEDFAIAAAGKASATALRAFLSAQLEIPEPQVIAELDKRMKALKKASPLVKKPTSPSVVVTRELSDVIDNLAHATSERIRASHQTTLSEVAAKVIAPEVPATATVGEKSKAPRKKAVAVAPIAIAPTEDSLSTIESSTPRTGIAVFQ